MTRQPNLTARADLAAVVAARIDQAEQRLAEPAPHISRVLVSIEGETHTFHDVTSVNIKDGWLILAGARETKFFAPTVAYEVTIEWSDAPVAKVSRDALAEAKRLVNVAAIEWHAALARSVDPIVPLTREEKQLIAAVRELLRLRDGGAVDTTEVAVAELTSDDLGTDASRWAEEFCRRFPIPAVDRGAVLGWFANAIETGRSAGTTVNYRTGNTPELEQAIRGVIDAAEEARRARRDEIAPVDGSPLDALLARIDTLRDMVGRG